MKKFIQNKLKDQKGLTLIELLAVIVIIAIIAAIAVPAIGNIIENSRYSAVKSDATNAIAAANIYFTENPEGQKKTGMTGVHVEVKELKDKGYLDSQGKLKDADFLTKTGTGINIKTTAIDYSGGKTVTFNSATNQQITGDAQKGSEAGPITVPKASAN
ncbi:prepilin-type N-terminal cleavage/methylation domain-containing protein [Planococcus sp. 107-1]|uniref:prepilin-type N-terminal cleavage/methylation domain-containing protein n=1 Tax=Planococcus sp. 107-1 TaxID=2908840 RepID=UPI001F38ACFB|nr:prepilin-type N-terminal cleavage/methylation domain-containing protein [Planococcus sp. 107-1]UJF28209.1 prepilin-type N-terminal cleavage/methylation domain-containing protein [Planococcus sp. 107-1]